MSLGADAALERLRKLVEKNCSFNADADGSPCVCVAHRIYREALVLVRAAPLSYERLRDLRHQIAEWREDEHAGYGHLIELVGAIDSELEAVLVRAVPQAPEAKWVCMHCGATGPIPNEVCDCDSALSPASSSSQAPDVNCYTLPDGSCIGTGCMHDATGPQASQTIKEALRAILDDAVGESHDPLWIVRRELIQAGRQALREHRNNVAAQTHVNHGGHPMTLATCEAVECRAVLSPASSVPQAPIERGEKQNPYPSPASSGEPVDLRGWLEVEIVRTDVLVRRAYTPSDFDYYQGWRDACFRVQTLEIERLRGAVVPVEHELQKQLLDAQREITQLVSDKAGIAGRLGNALAKLAALRAGAVVPVERPEKEP